MKLNEDYMILPAKAEKEILEVEITKEDSEFLSWIFNVKGIDFAEPDEETGDAQLSIEFEVVRPEVIPEEYESETDSRIVNVLGDIVVDILTIATKQESLKIQDADTESNS